MNIKILFNITLFISTISFQINANSPDSHALKMNKEFVLYTMPKTGTHLMQPLLKVLTNKSPVWIGSLISAGYVYNQDWMKLFTNMPDTTLIHWYSEPVPLGCFSSAMLIAGGKKGFVSGHVPYTKSMEALLKMRQATAFFVVRDPRDYIVSLLNYVNRTPNEIFVEEWFYKLDRTSQLAYIITGTNWYNSTSAVLQAFSGWTHSPVCCVVNFENLIGVQGGKTKQDQIKELRKIANALHLNIGDDKLLTAFKSVYGKGSTFHKGIAGAWREYFTPELKQLFKEHANQYLIDLGYETNEDW